MDMTAEYNNNDSQRMYIKKENIDDMEFQDNSKSETSSIVSTNTNKMSATGSKSKVFQCTGYGDCRMVFTRSEHLARHMRKHTGEKPFQCVVQGCERMFSRFDNMMQHTQTHNKHKSQKRSTKPSKSKRGGRRPSVMRNVSQEQSDSSYEHKPTSALPSPPISRSNSLVTANNKSQLILPQPIITNNFYQHSYNFGYSYNQHPYSLQTSQQHNQHSQQQQQQQNQQQPLFKENDNYSDYYQTYKRFPDSPTDSSSSSESCQNEPIISRRRSAPQIRYQPYPNSRNKQVVHEEILPTVNRRRHSVLSQLATYLVDHPDKSPESYLEEYNKPTRRLSIQDLANPIENLIMNEANDNKEEQDGVNLTEDEYLAIQGFGQFCKATFAQ